MENFQLIKKGKVKDIYRVSSQRLAFVFTDRISAFDVVLPSFVPMKGKILFRFAKFWFDYLKFPNHMLEAIEPNILIVKELKMIPLEFIVRGYIYGSLYERMIKKQIKIDEEPVLAKKLKEPFFETTTKYEEKDRPIDKKEILSKNWLSEEEYEMLKEVCIKLYQEMSRKASEGNFILADVKFEFGKDESGKILLADSLGPDEFRLWPKESYEEGKVQESFDKQPVRDWLVKIGYREELEKARSKGLPIPKPPELPNWLIEEVRNRYIIAYERITHEKIT